MHGYCVYMPLRLSFSTDLFNSRLVNCLRGQVSRSCRILPRLSPMSYRTRIPSSSLSSEYGWKKCRDHNSEEACWKSQGKLLCWGHAQSVAKTTQFSNIFILAFYFTKFTIIYMSLLNLFSCFQQCGFVDN